MKTVELPDKIDKRKIERQVVYEEASGSDDSEDEYVTHVRRRAAQYYKMMF